MVRKKSVAAKLRKRKERYKKKSKEMKISRPWRILILVIKAVKLFRRNKRNSSVAASLSSNYEVRKASCCVPSGCVEISSENRPTTFSNRNVIEAEFENLNIVKDVVKFIVSKVCRRENERIRQRERRDRKKDLSETKNVSQMVIRQSKQRDSFKKKYCQNGSFRKKRIEAVKSYLERNYRLNKDFHKKYNLKNKNRYHTNSEYHQRLKLQMWEKYRATKGLPTSRKHKIKTKYRTDNQHREKRKKQVKNKYHTDVNHRALRRSQIKRRYSKLDMKIREKREQRIKLKVLEKYYNNPTIRDLYNVRAKRRFLEKYRSDANFREDYKKKNNARLVNKYTSSSSIRIKKIKEALKHYKTTCTLLRQEERRRYNRCRRIMNKYKVNRGHHCPVEHRELYVKYLKEFREKNKRGPDYICVSCRLTFFRPQVVPYSEEKYIKEDMSWEVKEKIRSYVHCSSSGNEEWICKYCSEKLKKRQMPNRALMNKMNVCDIPLELEKLNNLEKHLIALRLPFLKIVNLSSGKVCGKYAQKGTKGPLHCVPSDVQETIMTLPRPIDKSMMVRLQLKRRLKYKAIWEEQFINPNDVRNALLALRKKHPGYRNINIREIDDNYLRSDKVDDDTIEENEFPDSPDHSLDDGESLIADIEDSDGVHVQPVASGETDDQVQSDEEVDEDVEDIRTKYCIGTDSCTQPSDFNDFLFYSKEPFAVAPAEKNSLSSLLTDKTIEGLAFPHLFPDGRGTFDEERETDLKWKQYCKARLFSSDSRFASDSSYIFYLQYLGDLKQVFSSISVAFRKKLPMTARHVLDESQMKFLMNKDMIFRHLQSVRGSPQYWHHRLKDLFGMTRQLHFSTFFLTLSCADIRWKEFLDIFARHSGEKVKSFYTYEEKTKLLRANPVLAARLFENRFNRFMNSFVKGGCWSLGKVTDWYARIEMQFRGSPHAHMPIWIEDAPHYNGTETNEQTRKEIVDFCDKYITTKFPSIEEDAELHRTIKDVQTHSRNHSKSCLKYHKTTCRFGFPRPVAYRTFICEPIKLMNDDDKQRAKKAKENLKEMNATMNELEREKTLLRSDFDNLLLHCDWTYDDYEWALRSVHTRAVMIHKREPNARWVNQYNEEMIRAWNANMDLQFVLDSYACAKYLMSYTTKPEREMSLLLEETHKECREGNMSVREEMKKLTGTFFNHRQVSVQEAIFRATKMPLVYSSRGFVFVPSHSNSCKFLKPARLLKQMDPDDENIYMSNLADKYFDRPDDPELDICLADFASEYELISISKKIKNPRTPVKYLKTLNFGVKKRCGRKAIIRFPYFNRETDRENYFENILCLYVPIRNREELKKPYELFYESGEIYDSRKQCMRTIKEVVQENRKKYESYVKETNEVESLFNELSVNAKEDDWGDIVANKEKTSSWISEIEQENNPDFNAIHKKKSNHVSLDLKQTFCSTNEMKPLLESMNEEQQKVFYHVREWCINRLHNTDTEPLRLFITGGAGTGKSHLLKCLQYEATKIFSRKKHLEPDENIDEVHTLITAFTGAAAVNVGGVTIHSAFGIGTKSNSLHDSLSCDRLNSYRCKLGSLKLLFVDEVSLIQANLWGAMHCRLTQIMGTHSNTAIFGNVSIIAIGDFYQCSPVAAQGIYSSLLWSDHFEIVELKINERQKTNASFAQMLNRIRTLKKNEVLSDEDNKRLEKCYQRYLNKEYSPEALHLFAKNDEVDTHNNKMIEMICTDIRTFHEVDYNGKEIKSNNNKSRDNLLHTLRLAKNARVMITKNISVSDGIANGIIGRIVDFIEIDNQVSHILIKCDLPKVGRIHRVSCPYCHGGDTICVVRESDNYDRQNQEFQGGKSKKQFPLRLSWAVTIHKAQGITVKEVVLSTKNLFGTGMGYTGISRVPVEEGLFLSDLFLKKLYCNEHVISILSQMKPMLSRSSVFLQSSDHLNLFCQNIESLQCNFKALKNHHLLANADIICLTETWINNTTSNWETFILQDYTALSRSRSESFGSNHPIRMKKGGGVLIYCKNNLKAKILEPSEQLNLEFISIQIEDCDIILITCYRSPQQNKTEFLDNLVKHLKEINLEKKIILVGDLNEDALSNDRKPIESHLNRLGFVNLFKDFSTTNSMTSLDCIYSNFITNNPKNQAVVGTFYGFHDALALSINMQEGKKDSVDKNNDENEEKMDTSNISHTSSSFSNRPDASNTRKRALKGTDAVQKNCKKRSINVHQNTANNEFLEKQLRFLSYMQKLKENRSANCSRAILTIDEQLANVGLKRINVLGDGNCFFRALSLQLYSTENQHSSFRASGVDHLLCYGNSLVPFLDQDEYSGIDEYIECMSTNGTYADFLMISSTAISMKKNIIIHEIGNMPILIPGCDFIEEQLHVLYHPRNLHYECVISLNGNTAILPPEQILFT